MQNIELKIKVGDFRDIRRKLDDLGGIFKGKMHQIDTYYNKNNARLKIREINNKTFEIISYRRPNTSGHKISNYNIKPLSGHECQLQKSQLRNTLGERVIVDKIRRLWLYKNTRIHLDKVKKLGNYLELETVVRGDIEEAMGEFNLVVRNLKLERFEKIAGSYSDIVLRQNDNIYPGHLLIRKYA